MIRITAVEPSRHVKGRFLVTLSDGSLLKVTDSEVAAYGLWSGKTLEADELAALRQAAARSNARATGLRILGARPLSRRELEKRLLEKGIAEADARAAADWLEEYGVLNDAEYACTLVRHYSRRGYGRRRIESELYRRGVDRSLWAAALQEATPAEDGIAAFLESRLRGKDTEDPKVIRRVSDALLRRGYSWSQIRQGLAEYSAQELPDDFDE